MNTKNLLKMAKHIRRLRQRDFDMSRFRDTYDWQGVKSSSKGCVLGHCVELDKGVIPRFKKSKAIMFVAWSEEFTGLDRNSTEWKYLFAPSWGKKDNTPGGAADRIMEVVDGCMPNNAKKIIRENEKL